MNIDLTKEQLQALIIFLERVDMKGREALMYAVIYTTLQKALSDEEKEE